MAKKKNKKKPNPVLEKKFQEGVWEGVQTATSFFLDKFEELKKEPGIGPKTQKKIDDIMFEGYVFNPEAVKERFGKEKEK